MQHRSGGRCRAVAKRRPSVERPQRSQNAEAEHQQRENPLLRRLVDRRFLHGGDQVGDAERLRAGLHVHADQADQRQQRAETEVERDFVGGIIAVRSPAPHADHDEGRHQREFVEEIEEKQIHRGKRAEDTADHQVEQNMKLLHPMRDVIRAAGSRKRHDRAHQNDADVDAVSGQVKM